MPIASSSEAGSGLATLGISASPGVPAALAELTLERALQRSRRGRKTFPSSTRENRRRYRGTGGGEHGRCAAGAEFLEGPARYHAARRRTTDFRRSHHRFSHRLWRRAKCLRHHAGLVRIRKNYRRWIAGSCLWRTPRHHGTDRAARPCLSGWDAFGQSAGDARGIGDTTQACRRLGFTTRSMRRPAPRRRFARRAERDRRSPAKCRCGFAADLVLYRRACPRLRRGEKIRYERFAAFFNDMLGRGIFLAPSQFEALFVSAAHIDADIDRTIAAARESLQAIRG